MVESRVRRHNSHPCTSALSDLSCNPLLKHLAAHT